jgi:hypothetical protein
MSLSGYHASASIRGRHDLASQVQSLASGQQLLVGAPASEQDVWAAPRPRSPTEPQVGVGMFRCEGGALTQLIQCQPSEIVMPMGEQLCPAYSLLERIKARCP